MSDGTLWIVILASAVGNYLIRWSGFFLAGTLDIPRPVRRFLSIMPLAALGALVFPGVFVDLPGEPVAAVAGLVTAALISMMTRNLILPVAASVGVVWAILRGG